MNACKNINMILQIILEICDDDGLIWWQ